jgi:hypothetical protein
MPIEQLLDDELVAVDLQGDGFARPLKVAAP